MLINKSQGLRFFSNLVITNFNICLSRQFDRVLELPSENWRELAQDWCCHGTSHLTSATGVLEPSEKDCFVGEYYIKVHPSIIVEPGRLHISPVRKDQIEISMMFDTFLAVKQQHVQWPGEG